jgi:protoporphyrinogen oxidase
VGGGMLGLTMAWDLAREGRRISVLEAGSTPGGLASPWKLGDVVWDRHYHVTLLSDSSLRGLLGELDLDREMRWNKTRTGFYCHGRLHPFSSAIDFARFPLLNPLEKIRFGLAVLRASRLPSPESIESLTVEEWLTRISGKPVFEKIWRPLLRAKLGDDYQTTSATFMWATIQRLYAARRSGLREELFGYLPGGYSLRRCEAKAYAFISTPRCAGLHLRPGAACMYSSLTHWKNSTG